MYYQAQHKLMGLDMIYTIGYARGIAALFVVLFHFRDYINGAYAQANIGEILFGPGVSGVDVFFVISGFIIVYSTKKNEKRNAVNFIIRRFFRIYPLLFLSVIMFTFVTPENFTPLQIIKSLLPAHLDYSQESPYFGYNVYVPAWTITYEIFFYSIFVTAMCASHRYRAAIASLTVLAMYLAVNLYFDGSINLDAHHKVGLSGVSHLNGLLYLASSPMMLEFVFGMLLAMIHGAINEEIAAKLKSFSSLYLWFSFGLLLTFWFSWWRFGHGPLNFGLWAATIIPSILLYEKCHTIPLKKRLLFLGDISYSLYMTHIVVVYALGWYADVIPLYKSLNGFAKLFYVVTLCMTIAYVCHVVIERPMHKLSRALIKRLN